MEDNKKGLLGLLIAIGITKNKAGDIYRAESNLLLEAVGWPWGEGRKMSPYLVVAAVGNRRARADVVRVRVRLLLHGLVKKYTDKAAAQGDRKQDNAAVRTSENARRDDSYSHEIRSR